MTARIDQLELGHAPLVEALAGQSSSAAPPSTDISVVDVSWEFAKHAIELDVPTLDGSLDSKGSR